MEQDLVWVSRWNILLSLRAYLCIKPFYFLNFMPSQNQINKLKQRVLIFCFWPLAVDWKIIFKYTDDQTIKIRREYLQTEVLRKVLFITENWFPTFQSRQKAIKNFLFPTAFLLLPQSKMLQKLPAVKVIEGDTFEEEELEVKWSTLFNPYCHL